jgi:hypothetical protein
MTKSHHLIGILTAALAGLSAASCEVTQPRPDCTVGRDAFAARYTLKDGPATGACREKKGERIGLQKYNPAIQTADGPKPDLFHATIAIQPETLGNINGDPAHPLLSQGDFPITPDRDDFCTAPQLSRAEQHIAATGTSPAIDIVYEWSNVRVLNAPEALGTQLAAELRYTEGGCTATYTVDALWPSVSCENEAGEADVRLCSPVPLPDDGILVGSGINSLFPIECHPDLKLCVLSSSVPALKPR